MNQSGYLLKLRDSNLTFPLCVGRTTLGRSTDCDVCIDHMHISREHCLFEFKEAALFLRDLNSTNGTKVNRRLIAGEHKLEVGDEIDLGQVS